MIWKSLNQASQKSANGIVIKTVDAFDVVTCSLSILYQFFIQFDIVTGFRLYPIQKLKIKLFVVTIQEQTSKTILKDDLQDSFREYSSRMVNKKDGLTFRR